MTALSLAAQFSFERHARDAYAMLTQWQGEHLARHHLSTFRLQSERHWYVIVVGEADDLEPFRPLVPYLQKTGRIIAISDETIDGLMAKREAVTPS